MTQHSHRRSRALGSLVAVSALSALTLAACGGGGDDSGSNGGGSTEAADSFAFTFGNATGATDNPWQTIAEKYSEDTGVQIETNALDPEQDLTQDCRER